MEMCVYRGRGRGREREREREIRQVLTFVVKNCILTQGNYECAVDV